MNIGASTGGNTVTGTVNFAGTATGPLYVGFYDQTTNQVYASTYVTPVTGQTFSVQVPNGSNYYFFGIIDQNNNGFVDAGDINNTDTNANPAPVVINGSVSNQNLTLPTVTKATVSTNHSQNSGINDSYTLNFDVRGSSKLAVAVSLTSGPNVLLPADIAGCAGCNNRFQSWTGTDSIRPKVGDAYSFKVTYPDNSSETVTATVSVVLDAFPANLAPTGSNSGNMPTFTWTAPANQGNYTDQFWISEQSNGSINWQVPGNNSNSTLPGTTTSLVWGTDPTDPSNTPSFSLTSGHSYQWQVMVQDKQYNSASQSATFQQQ